MLPVLFKNESLNETVFIKGILKKATQCLDNKTLWNVIRARETGTTGCQSMYKLAGFDGCFFFQMQNFLKSDLGTIKSY